MYLNFLNVVNCMEKDDLVSTVTITDNSFSSPKWVITTTSVTKLEAVLPCLGECGCFSAGLSSQCGVKLLTAGWDPLQVCHQLLTVDTQRDLQ